MTVQDKYLVDKTIAQLDKNKRIDFYRQYQYTKKKKPTLFMLTNYLFILGGPFFYLGFKNSRPLDYISVLVFWLGLYPFFVMLFIMAEVSIVLALFLLLAGLIYFIWIIYLNIVCAMKVEQRVDDYNYGVKLKILNNIK